KSLARIGYNCDFYTTVGYRESIFIKIVRALTYLTKFLRTNYDLIIVDNAYYDGLIALLLYKTKRIPYIIYLKGDTIAENKSRSKPVLSKSMIWFFKKVVENAVYIVFISQWLSHRCLTSDLNYVFMKKNSSVIHHAPDVSFKNNLINKSQDKDKVIFSYVGRFYPAPKAQGVLFLMEAIGDLLSFTNDFILYIAGDGPYKNEIEKLIRKYSLENNVIMLGRLSKRDVKDLYLKSDFMLYSSFLDACPSTVLEAQSCGTPVINIGHTGASELLAHPFSYDLGRAEKEEIVNYLLSVIRSGKKRPRNFVSPFTWDKTAEKFDDVIKSVLDGHYYRSN
ncbi:MAG: glycosyltransferase family 4 protein, partial [Promethearchaeota archaeon]